jgi:hypothetical protein
VCASLDSPLPEKEKKTFHSTLKDDNPDDHKAVKQLLKKK